MLPGASGAAHEIDLVLDAPLAGRTWHVAVECKDHARPVEKETAAGFRAVLLDVNERLPEEEKMTGILVSRSGFRSGAIALAGYCGICLMEIRRGDRGRFRVSFWTEGRFFSFHLSMQALFSRERPDLIVNLPRSSRQWQSGTEKRTSFRIPSKQSGHITAELGHFRPINNGQPMTTLYQACTRANFSLTASSMKLLRLCSCIMA